MYILRGVVRGSANPWMRPIVLAYFVNRPFDGSDERRLLRTIFGDRLGSILPG